MKYTILILLLAPLAAHSQVYMGCGPGIFSSTTRVYNEVLHTNESFQDSYMAFTAIAGARNAYNFIFEGQVTCTGSFIISGSAGYQIDISKPQLIDKERDISDSRFNLQLFAGPADIMNIRVHLQFTHTLSYIGGARLNLRPFYLQVHSSAHTLFTQIGIKGYLFN